MRRAIYRVILEVKPEEATAFNTWYEGEYIPKLLSKVPHFLNCRRYVCTDADTGETTYVTDYDTTEDTFDLAIAEMRSPERKADNELFYQWKDRAITRHTRFKLVQSLELDQTS